MPVCLALGWNMLLWTGLGRAWGSSEDVGLGGGAKDFIPRNRGTINGPRSRFWLRGWVMAVDCGRMKEVVYGVAQRGAVAM
jgi:hypothetical protein